ncbi:kinase-like domain-containing protein [Aspergillus crustosus]
MEQPRVSRFLDPSSAVAAITKHKAEAIRLAREQGAAVRELCRRAKTEAPPYEFEELIGKGAYGRVYKGHQLPSRQVVALKVLDIDSLDYKSVRDFRDESIKDFIHETKVMKQVKDSGAKNINAIIEAVSIHAQLWLVCEYCPGGSVRTLMRATGDRLEEKFAIPVARELAAGLRAIHDAGIIHRDIKAANVLIHEEGRLQICDFGVAGVLQSQMDKRSTWIGTPHWMPPEMFTGGQGHQYSSEIDVWAYGCTLFEMATGNPPNANLRERMQIGRQLNRNTPKLADGDKYPEGLRDLVAFALNSDPIIRPAMSDIILHPYIANSKEEYPTSSLSELVRIYYQWSQRGGQRVSLFHPGGAAAAEVPEDESDIEEDWNFSTTDDFERRFSVIDLDQLAASLAEMEQEINDTGSQSGQDTDDEFGDTEMTEHDKANFDERVRRGAAAMEGLFDEEKPSYKYETKNDFVPIEEKAPASDLPLRTDTDRSSVTSTFIDIDIGSFDSSHYAAGATTAQPFQLADADTIRANRSSGRQNRSSNEGRSRSSSSGVSSTFDAQEAFQPRSGPRPPTMDWKFPSFTQTPEEPEADIDMNIDIDSGAEAESESEPDHIQDNQPLTYQADKRATMEWTFPMMSSTTDDETDSQASSNAASPRHDTLKADDPNPIVDEPTDSRPSTSQSNISTSSDTDYDPFRFDRPATPPDGNTSRQQDFVDHKYPELLTSVGYDRYSRSSVLEGPGPDEEDEEEEEKKQPQNQTQHPQSWQSSSETSEPLPYTEPFPTSIPSKEMHMTRPFPRADESPVSEPLPTARYDPHPHPHPQSHPHQYPHPPHPRHSQSMHDLHPYPHPHPHRPASLPPIQFPDLLPPRLEVLMDGAGEAAVTAELDRLLSDFLDALSATGEALSRTRIPAGVREEAAVVSEKSE